MYTIRRIPYAIILALTLLLGLAALPVAAAEFRAGDRVTIGSDETISEDVYLAGGTLIVEGTIDGDLTVAGGIVQLRGNVTGSVNVAGGQLEIGGTVGGAVRAAGGDTTISGAVGRDVVAAGGNILIASSASVGADVAGGVGRLNIAGAVEGDVLAGAGELIISGSVGGNVDSEVGQLRVESGAQIAGDVRYGSEREAEVATDAQIGGTLERREPRLAGTGPLLGENPVTLFLGSLLALLLLGWGLMLLRPTLVVGPGVALRSRPLKAVGAGLIVWLVQFVLVILLVILAALVSQLAASLGGAFLAPLLLVILAIVAGLLLAQVWVAMAIGSWLATRISQLRPWLAYAVGALVWVLLLSVLSFISGVLGGILFFVAWILGLGAITLYVMDTRRRESLSATQPPAGGPYDPAALSRGA